MLLLLPGTLNLAFTLCGHDDDKAGAVSASFLVGCWEESQPTTVGLTMAFYILIMTEPFIA